MGIMDNIQRGLANMSCRIMQHSYNATMMNIARRTPWSLSGYGMGRYGMGMNMGMLGPMGSIFGCAGRVGNPGFTGLNYGANGRYLGNGMLSSLQLNGGASSFPAYMAMNQGFNPGFYDNFIAQADTGFDQFYELMSRNYENTPTVKKGNSNTSTVTGGDDTVTGGDDTITSGDDTVTGGDDTVTGGDDTVTGGDDTITSGDDTVTGGDDTITSGDDTVTGGDDTITSGNDTIAGGRRDLIIDPKNDDGTAIA